MSPSCFSSDSIAWSFDRRTFHIEMETEKATTSVESKEVFLLTEESRSIIEKELGFTSPGVYYSSDTKGILEEAIKIRHAKLALLKWSEEGYILLN